MLRPFRFDPLRAHSAASDSPPVPRVNRLGDLGHIGSWITHIETSPRRLDSPSFVIPCWAATLLAALFLLLPAVRGLHGCGPRKRWLVTGKTSADGDPSSLPNLGLLLAYSWPTQAYSDWPTLAALGDTSVPSGERAISGLMVLLPLWSPVLG